MAASASPRAAPSSPAFRRACTAARRPLVGYITCTSVNTCVYLIQYVRVKNINPEIKVWRAITWRTQAVLGVLELRGDEAVLAGHGGQRRLLGAYARVKRRGLVLGALAGRARGAPLQHHQLEVHRVC